MTATQTVSAKPELGERQRARRADRLNARSVLWRESTLDRVKKCGKVLAADNETGVSVRVSTLADGTRLAGFGGLQTCGSPWVCPVCSAKIAGTRQTEVDTAMRSAQDLGLSVVMLTLTMRHNKGQRLKTLWDGKSKAWSRAIGGAGWKKDQEAYGFQMTRTIKSGKRAGDQVTEMRIPSITVTEVTHGKSGWHVHVHSLLFVRQITDASADELGRSMYGRWSDALAAEGFRRPLEEHGVEAHLVQGRGDGLGDYFTKQVYDAGTSGVALEVTRGDLKDGRMGNRHPFVILRGITGHADYRDGDLELWHEWEAGSHRRNQLLWSPGLRKLLAVTEVEQTDEEIAAEEHGGSTVVWIEKDGWRLVVRQPRLLSLILDLAEEPSSRMLRMMLQVEGIPYTVPEPLGGPS